MAKIHAGISELKSSHHRLSTFWGNAGAPAYLLLFYAAECGLKYAELKRRNLRTTEQLEDVDHDLNRLIKSLNVPAAVLGAAPALRLSRPKNEPCPHSSAHQAWRYGVRIDPNAENEFVAWLRRICDFVRREYL